MAKKKEVLPSNRKELLENLSKRIGGKVHFIPIGDIASTYSLRRPVGIPSLDINLRGGFPANCVVQLFGPDGVGKDYIANCTMAEVQRNYGDEANIFTCSFGADPDKTALLMAGVSLPYTEELLELGITENDPRYAGQLRQVGELVHIELDPTSSSPAEDILGAVLCCLETGVFQLGIVNELPAAETKWHAETSLGGDAKRSALASLMSDFQRKYNLSRKKVKNNETTIIVINQVRANQERNNAYSPKYVQTGGFALAHMKAVDIHLNPVGKIKVGDTQVGKRVGYYISKGKMGLSEGAGGEFDFYFYRGADIEKDLISVATKLGIIEKRGGYYLYKDLQDNICQVQGMDNLTTAIRETTGLYEVLRAQVMQKSGLEHVRYN